MGITSESWSGLFCSYPIGLVSRGGNWLRFHNRSPGVIGLPSFSDFPLRYDRRGSSLKILLCCGWFCIKSHFFFLSISFNLSNAGCYCATKGRIRNYFLLCRSVFILKQCFSLRKFVFWLMFFYSLSWVACILKACPEVSCFPQKYVVRS